MSIRFEWDSLKDIVNQRKHGVSFSDAQNVFYDERALLIGDTSHSEEEDRFILLGLSLTLRKLVVCHCYRDDAEIIRIISARKATRNEARQYTLGH